MKMPALGTASSAILSGGIGASIGSVITAIVQTVSGKKESRARAADIIETTAGRWLDRLNERNETLEDENSAYRQALNLVEDAAEELIAVLHEEQPDLVRKVRGRLAEARTISLARKPTEVLSPSKRKRA
jgi:membrane-bound ClpP family serine protease